jgi:hypothetical protein
MATVKVRSLRLHSALTLLVTQAFDLQRLAGLFAFQLAEGAEGKQASAAAAGAVHGAPKGTWYCFTLAVARALRVTTRAVAQSVSRHCSAAEAASVLRLKRSDLPAASFARLLSTYAAVKQQLDGAVDSLHSRKGDKFSLYPLPVVVKLLAVHSPSKVDAATLETVRAFVQKQQQQQAAQPLAFAARAASFSAASAAAAQHPMAMELDDGAAAPPALEAPAAGMDLGVGLGPGLGLQPAAAAGAGAAQAAGLFERKDNATGDDSAWCAEETKIKLEPGRRRQARSLPVSSFLGGIPVVDLTHPATLAALSRFENEDKPEAADTVADVEQTVSSLVDNFSLWHPVLEEYAVLREYGLRPDEVSVLLQEQCQRFSEYRQEIWNWHRDPSQVTPRTVGNNIRVFLLFGGFVCHSAKRHRLKPAAFDMSVFGSKHIEAYIMDFLQVLLRRSLCSAYPFCVASTCTARASSCSRRLPTTSTRWSYSPSSISSTTRSPTSHSPPSALTPPSCSRDCGVFERRPTPRPRPSYCRSRCTPSGCPGPSASKCVARAKRRTSSLRQVQAPPRRRCVCSSRSSVLCFTRSRRRHAAASSGCSSGAPRSSRSVPTRRAT